MAVRVKVSKKHPIVVPSEVRKQLGIRSGDELLVELCDGYAVLLANDPNLTVAAIDRPIARRAAELRARQRGRPADALQVAACLEQGTTAFLTT